MNGAGRPLDRLDRSSPAGQTVPMLLYDAPNPAPNPRRVRIFLAEKGVTVPIRTMSIIAGEHKSAEFIAKYPPGQLPVLELDDGAMLGESVSICRYLEQIHPDPPMFGANPRQAALVDMMIRRVEFTLMMPVAMVWVHTHPLTARIVPHQYTDFGESNRARAAGAMRALDAGLADGGPWIAGADFSMADIVLLTTVDFASFIGLAMPDDVPALTDWHRRASERTSASA